VLKIHNKNKKLKIILIHHFGDLGYKHS